MTRFLIALVAAAGCTSLDEHVDTEVVSVNVSPQLSAPDAIAPAQLTLRMVAGSRADHELALDSVTIDEQDLAIAPFDPMWIHAGETKELPLANAGTTNAELAPLCGRTVNLFVYLTFLDSVSGSKSEGSWTSTRVAVTCQ